MLQERFIIAEVINPELAQNHPYLQIKKDKVIVGASEVNRAKIGSFL
jgi:hypothetical protein